MRVVLLTVLIQRVLISVRRPKDPAQSRALAANEDPAKLIRREDQALVYLVRDDAGGLDKIILPIRGYGLWSTMYGFMALESDGNTVAGLGFLRARRDAGAGWRN